MYGHIRLRNLKISWKNLVEISQIASVLKEETEQMMNYWINLDLWETADLPLP